MCAVFLIYGKCWSADFIVIGDSRPGSGNEHYEMTKRIINDAITYTESRYTLAGIIMTGDYVNSSRDEQQWADFCNANEQAFESPIYPCPGNHDTGAVSLLYRGWNYYETFTVPRWYSVDIENLHLVSIDSNLALYAMLQPYNLVLELMQYQWLKQDLSRNQKKFTVVIWHAPAYGSHSESGSGHGSNTFMRMRYVPVCESSGVNVIICGHNHWYERTFPVKNQMLDENGITHVTTGGGGTGLIKVSSNPGDKVHDAQGTILSAVNISAYHFCILSTDSERLALEAVEYETHTILDSFEMVPHLFQDAVKY